MQAYLENLETGKGAWLNLPIHSTEEFEDFLEKNGLTTFSENDELEFTDIHFDTELVLSMEEAISIPKLNYSLRQFEVLDKHNQHKVLALLEAFGNTLFDLEYALDNFDSLTLLENVHNTKEVGQYIMSRFIESGKLSFVPDGYDYQELGQHALDNDYFILTSYGALC